MADFNFLLMAQYVTNIIQAEARKTRHQSPVSATNLLLLHINSGPHHGIQLLLITTETGRGCCVSQLFYFINLYFKKMNGATRSLGLKNGCNTTGTLRNRVEE